MMRTFVMNLTGVDEGTKGCRWKRKKKDLGTLDLSINMNNNGIKWRQRLYNPDRLRSKNEVLEED